MPNCPPTALAGNDHVGLCPGRCDCGGVPCGEYLYDHVSGGEPLRQFLVNDFIMGPLGMGNPNISGFYIDDQWYNYTVYNGTRPECTNSPIGGPTEEDFNCTKDVSVCVCEGLAA